jgi:hypothetical protein
MAARHLLREEKQGMTPCGYHSKMIIDTFLPALSRSAFNLLKNAGFTNCSQPMPAAPRRPCR